MGVKWIKSRFAVFISCYFSIFNMQGISLIKIFVLLKYRVKNGRDIYDFEM